MRHYSSNRPWKNRRESSRYTATQVSGIDWGASIRNSIRASLGGENSSWAAAAAAAAQEDEIEDSVSSRYDPRSMNLVPDINEMAEGDSDDSSDVEGAGSDSGGGVVAHKKKSKTKQKRGLLRQPLVMIGFIAVIVGVAGFQINKQRQNTPTNQHSGATFQVEQERLLGIAEQVISACSEHSLNADMRACQRLCLGRLCCSEDEESDRYCGDDESMNCAVYVGCRALVNGFTPVGAAPMSEQRRVKWG